MTAVGYRFRAELRARWKSVAALALLAGIAGAATLAAVAGARRTDSAYSRLLVATNAAEVLVNPDFGNDSGLDWKAVAKLPMVEQAAREDGLIVLPLPVRSAEDIDNLLTLGLEEGAGTKLARPHVIDGRAPRSDRAHEVLVNPEFAKRHQLEVGDSFDALAVNGDELEAVAQAGGSFASAVKQVNAGTLGTKLRLRVTGIGVTPEEIVLDEGFEMPELFTTPAFLRHYPQGRAGFFGVQARLRRGAADIAAFKKAVQALPHEGAIEFQTTTATEAKVERAVRPQVGALTIFAVIVAITGMLLVGQALARQTFLDSVDHPTLRSLGFGGRQLTTLAMLRALVIAAVASLIAVVLAVAASPLTPIGVARDADPDLGLYVDVPVVILGALAVFAVVVLLAAGPAWWYARSARHRATDEGTRPSRLASWLRSSGAPLSAGTGVRMALEPGRGRTAVPVRTTIVGAALAIATVVAAFTFAASLDHLLATPRLYGFTWDARVDGSGDTEADAAKLHDELGAVLERDRSVAAFSDGRISRVDVNGVTVTAIGVRNRRGKVGPTVISGRAPRAANEIALGSKTMARIGVEVGDTVRARPDAGGRAVPLRVVGKVVLPGLGTYQGSDKTALGEGAVLTWSELRRLGPDFGPGAYLVRLAPTATRAELARAVTNPRDPLQVQVTGLQRPSDIVSYERVRTTPLALAGVLALLAIATVAHALVTAVRRRRRDLALLKTLGFTRRQVSASVAWQATTFGVLALAIGVPVGSIVGRWAWTNLADDLGTVAEPIVPALALLVAIPAVLVIANLVAFVPGRIAARVRPAAVLRSE